jgi:hypothetical protein
MKCRNCGEELVFVLDARDKNNIAGQSRIRAFHTGTINTHDRDTFSAGAHIVEPSLSTQYRLRSIAEQQCRE